MKAPGTAYDDPVLGKDPQPAHMNDYVQTADDNGGVHINSGIPNHAFYLARHDARRVRVGEGRADLVRRAGEAAAADSDFQAAAGAMRTAASCGSVTRSVEQQAVAEGMARRSVVPISQEPALV